MDIYIKLLRFCFVFLLLVLVLFRQKKPKRYNIHYKFVAMRTSTMIIYAKSCKYFI